MGKAGLIASFSFIFGLVHFNTNMKKVYPLLIMVICLIGAKASRAQMRQLFLDATDSMNEVQEFSFYSPSEGYVAFTKYIGFTTDSGRTITRKFITISNVNFNNYPVNLTFGFGIKGLKAFSRDTIIVYGDYGLVPSILYSTNGGASFELVYHDRYNITALKTGITSMVFPQDHTIGYAVEADRILKTTNKGLNWFVVKQDIDRYYDHVAAIDNNNIFAFSTNYNSYKLVKTNNGGSTWTDVTTPAGQIGYAYFLTATKGWLYVKNDQSDLLYYTSNGGVSWQQKNDPEITPFYSTKFQFVNDSTGYALSGLFTVYKTTDSGKVWQRLPRDNNFSYLNYSHNDLQVLNPTQLWAGGGHGFIEINTNAGGNPLPTVFFKVDTTGVSATGEVNLRNYSKPGYQFKWLKNDTLISTAYHARFTRNSVYQFRDTIKLIVSDGTYSDTLVKYVEYAKVWITGFTPTSAAWGAEVTINGYNLSGTFAVKFGGESASSFTVVSNTQVRATVGYGATGNIEVFTTPQGAASTPGFTFLGNPKVDLPATISDSILCKAEPVTVTIQNTEPGVVYQFVNWEGLSKIYGSANGNGGTITFVTSPISQSGQYRIRVNRSGGNGGTPFNTYFNIKVEHTKARFVADQVNITPGEPVTYAAQAGEAKDYYWTLYEDASTNTATGAKVTSISYTSSGQKTLQLISVSENGCRDTVQANATFVYVASGADASCIINPLDSTGVTGMGVGQVLNGYNDDIYVLGGTFGAPKLRSMAGVAKDFGPGNHIFFAKYNANGVLKWAHYFKPGAGSFTAGQTDAQGNIYLTGYALSNQCLYFNNGDSMQFYARPADTTLFGERTSGFILKLDRNGQYIWHTILYDPIVLNQGKAADASADKIAIKDNHIVVIGGFYNKLSYVRNGVIQDLYDLPSGDRVHENHAVLKIGTDGMLLWNAVLRFHATNYHRLTDVSVDKSGNCYLVGSYENYLGIFNASGVEKVTLNGVTGNQQAFMVKYNAAGGIEWHNNFVSSNQYGDASLNRVMADDDGNTYVAGEMTNWVDITHSDGTTYTDSVIRFALYKFDTYGKRRWSVGSRNAYDGSTSALYISGNEVYAAGQLNNTITAEDQASVIFVSSDGTNKVQVINGAECFVVKYDTAGIFKRMYTSGYNYLARSLAATSIYKNSKGQFVLGGNAYRYLGGSVNKIFGTTWPHAFINASDGFFVKLGADFCHSALTADAGPDKIGCVGDTVTIGARTSGAYYSWTSSPAGFTSNLPNPIPKPRVNTTYYLKVTNDAGETAFDTVVVALKPAPIADAGRDTTICSNKVVFLSTPEIPGYTYQWYLLPTGTTFGVTVGTTAQVRLYPTVNSTYRLKVVGANGCPAYDTVVVSMLYNGAPRVVIKGPPALTVCKGDQLTFTTTISNMGPNPVYQWKVRNQKVGTNSSTYTTDSLKNGDYISVDVTHNNTCELQPTVSGTAGAYTVAEVLKPAVTLTGNTVVNEGDATVINATVSNAGTGYQLKWQDSTSTHDWQDLPLPPLATNYNYKPAATGDKIRLTLTVSSACAITPVSSATMNFTVNKVTGIDPVPAAQYGLRYYPNPVQKILTIDGLRLADRWQQLQVTGIDGQQNLLLLNVKNCTRVEVATEGLRPGMYVAILRNTSGVEVYLKFIKL